MKDKKENPPWVVEKGEWIVIAIIAIFIGALVWAGSTEPNENYTHAIAYNKIKDTPEYADMIRDTGKLCELYEDAGRYERGIMLNHASNMDFGWNFGSDATITKLVVNDLRTTYPGCSVLISHLPFN